MKCPDLEQIADYREGLIPADRMAKTAKHIRQCEVCQTRLDEVIGLTNQLAPSPGEFDDPALADDVMQLIRLGQAEKYPLPGTPHCVPRWFWPCAGGAVAAALAFVFLFFDFSAMQGNSKLDTLPVSTQTRARGGSDENPSRWLSIEVYKTTGDGYQGVNDVIYCDDGLAFAYLNRADQQYTQLMILGVDEHHKIFWYYPAYEKEGTNPGSIPIRRTERPILLPDAVRHDLTRGKLTLMALFSKKVLDVLSVEKQIHSVLRRAEPLSNLTSSLPQEYEIVTQTFLLDVIHRKTESSTGDESFEHQ